MTRLHAHNLARVIVSLVLVSFFGARDVAAQSCYLPFVWENKNRHVYGDVNVECGGCPPFTHSSPWGNWGVDSVSGRRSNDSQFRGWQNSTNAPPCYENLSSKPEWNSCTSDFAQADANWYNWNNYTEQWSPDIRNFAGESITYTQCPFDWNYDGEIDDGGCGNGTGWRQFSFGGRYMKLYEMDGFPWPGDDPVTQLNYANTFVIDLWCDGWSCGSGNSGWQNNSSNSIASSPVMVRSLGGAWDDPNGCCQDGVNYCQ